MRPRTRAIDQRLVVRAILLLVFSFPFLASSVTFCESGDIYNKSYDQTDEFWSRWENGQAQITPHWTPDGSRIVFGHRGRIYAVDADGESLDLLSGSSLSLGPYSGTHEIDFSPSVSPDGSQVVYTTLRYATGELYKHTYEIAVQNIEGGDLRRLTSNSWNDVSPSWSPDGTRIAFVSEKEGSPQIFTVAPDGSDERTVAPGVIAQFDAPVWSPDGSRLAFVGEEKKHQTVDWIDTYNSTRFNRVTKTSGTTVTREALYISGADGSDLKKLAWANGEDANPSTREGINDLILPEEEIIEFRWSPDSKQIAFLAKRYGRLSSLYVAQLDGSEVRQISDFYEIWESKRYDGISIVGFGWSSDASRINFEIAGHTYAPDWELTYSVHTIASDGSEQRTLTEVKTTKLSAVDNHLEWPTVLLLEPAPGRGYRSLPEYYRTWPNILQLGSPARVLRYDYGFRNLGYNNREPLLSLLPWDSIEEKVLVMTDGRRVILAEPSE